MKADDVRKLGWLIREENKPFLFTERNGRYVWKQNTGETTNVAGREVRDYVDASPNNLTLNSAYWWMQGYLTRYVKEL